MKDINKALAKEMLNKMSQVKRTAYHNAVRRNLILTSSYDLEDVTMTVYKEGWYLVLEGCRSKFAIWYNDEDGELVEGRKPVERKLHKLYTDFGKFWEIEEA